VRHEVKNRPTLGERHNQRKLVRKKEGKTKRGGRERKAVNRRASFQIGKNVLVTRVRVEEGKKRGETVARR